MSGSVKGLHANVGAAIEAERRHRPFASIEDFAHRTGVGREELRVLAEIGALNRLAPERRAALWKAERAARAAGPLLEASDPVPDHSPLTPMTAAERVSADYRGTGLTIDPHPIRLCRAQLAAEGVIAAKDLPAMPDRRRVRTPGMVIARQRPGTAKGCFHEPGG